MSRVSFVLFDEIKNKGRRSQPCLGHREDLQHEILLHKRLAVKELVKVDNWAGRIQ